MSIGLALLLIVAAGTLGALGMALAATAARADLVARLGAEVLRAVSAEGRAARAELQLARALNAGDDMAGEIEALRTRRDLGARTHGRLAELLYRWGEATGRSKSAWRSGGPEGRGYGVGPEAGAPDPATYTGAAPEPPAAP